MNYWVRYMISRHGYGLARFYRGLIICGAGILLTLALANIPLYGALSKVMAGSSFSLFDIAVSWGERDPRGLMRSAVPVLAWVGNQEDLPEEITPGSLVTAVLAPFRVNLSSPADLIASEMPALAEYKRSGAAAAASAPAAAQGLGATGPGPLIPAATLVGIYHTHTGETYALTDGAERLSGQKGGVVEAGKAIRQVLEKEYGIGVAHDERVNDENYSLSYTESEKTARRLLEENKDIQVILDVHRDAGKPRKDSVVLVNGKEMAPILFIVGSDARAPFPTWRNNHDFAVKLAARINRESPGLCIGVRIKEGRYNQFLHPRAMLVEIGSVSNSTEEAVLSASLLARALALEIMEMAPGKVGRGGSAGSRDGVVGGREDGEANERADEKNSGSGDGSGVGGGDVSEDNPGEYLGRQNPSPV